jgi:hypothetical protein
MSARAVSLLAEWAADYGNVCAALEWAAASEPCVAMRLQAETKDLFFILGQADGSRLAELMLQRCPERSRDRAEVLVAAGHFAYLLGNMPDGIDLMAQAAELSVELGERAVEGTAHWFLGLHQMFGGAPERHAIISPSPAPSSKKPATWSARRVPRPHSDSPTF